MQKRVKVFRGVVPLVAVTAGLHGLHSAWAAILIYHLGALSFLALERPPVWGRLRHGWRAGPVLLLGLVSLLAPISIIVLWPLAGRDGVDLSSHLLSWGLSEAGWTAFVFYFVGVHPIVEELYWRGGERADGVPIGWQDVAFASYHAIVLLPLMKWPWVLVAVAILTLTSALWRFAVRRGGFGAVVAAHAIGDAGVLVAAVALMHGWPQ